MTAPLTGLELRRKACEALGYRHNPNNLSLAWADWRKPDGSYHCYESKGDGSTLPAIESKPAVAIPTLIQFCKANGFGWNVSMSVSGIYRCSIFKDGFTEYVKTCEGSDPCECIARAIVAASEVEATK